MANKIVRSIREVKDVNKLAQHVTTENDLVSTTDGSVYIVTKNGYKLITDGANVEDIEPLKTDITTLKSENTKLKNRVTDLETSNTDLITRIEVLENPDTTP